MPTDLFFSEYIEGSSNNKALELYNGTGAAVDLAAGGYAIEVYFNGNTTPTTIANLTGTIANGAVFVLAPSNANTTILAKANQTSGSSFFNGDDAVVLRKGGSSGPIIDVIGQIGNDPGSEWSGGGVGTQDETLQRKATVTAGDPNGSDSFDPSVEWVAFAQDTFDGLGSHAIVTDTTPPTLVSFTRKTPSSETTSADVLIFLATFSEDVVNVDAADFAVTGTTGAIAVSQITAATYDITISGGDLASLSGTVGLNLASQDITDLAANALPSGEPATDETYTVTNSTPAPSPAPSPVMPSLAPAAAGTLLSVNDLGTANTVSLQIEQSAASAVAELLVFSTDANGGSRTQISSFFLLQGQQLPADYAPVLTLDSAQVANGTVLQFELVQNGVTQRAAISSLNANQIRLDFGGLQFLAVVATQTAQTNLLVGDAAALDLTGQSGAVNMRFSVYREAAYDNTVGFYTTDFANGGIRDTLTGTVLNPGDAGYQAAALARQLDVQLTGKNNQTSAFSAVLPGGEFLGMFLIVHGDASGEVYFSHAGANRDGADHVRLLGNNTFGFEDLAGLGDADYDDVVVAFELF